MWKTFLLLALFLVIYPVIEGKRTNSDSAGCPKTNRERFCKRACSSDSKCRPNQKCLCDGDCGMTCVRNSLKCEDLPKVKNARHTLTNGSYFNSVVTYTCNQPFKLRGSDKRTCRATGKWDGRKTRCKIFCDDPGDIASGNRRYDSFQAGKYINHWCFENFIMVGSPMIRCLDTGKWSAPKPRCEPPKCDPPSIPESADVIYPKRMRRKFKYNSRVVLKCKDGYFKSGLGVYQCLRGNKWRGGITCSPKSCGRPKDIPNGKIIGYVYSFKRNISYECDEGYKLKGPGFRICQANEEWGGNDPICEVVNCGPLQKPAHGDIIEQVALSFGNRIVFDCTEKGYEMKGSRERTCQSDGTWSGSPTTCEIVRCGDPGTPKNGQQIISKGYVYGGSLTFRCNKGYTLIGAQTIYCQENKRWTASVPYCRASCPDPGNPLPGRRIGDVFSHGKKVSFTCPRDYVIDGARTITCSHGQWSDSMPSCRAPCVQPPVPAHGRIEGGDFRHGQSVNFWCFYGYTRVGASPITCNDGNWDKQFPVCKGFCATPRNPDNGKLHAKIPPDRFLDGDEATFSCDDGYDLFGKPKLRIRCVGKRWDSSVPECKAQCKFLGRPDHGFYIKGQRSKGDMIKHGEKISYRCLPSYTMVGASTQECDNGRWTNVLPTCKESCGSPGDINHGQLFGNDFGHGKTVTYRCDVEYTLDGLSKLRCDDGSWNSGPPTCRAPCHDPGSPADGKRQVQDLRHNSWVTFTCDQNYQLDGKRQIQCNDGVWSDNVPRCVGLCPNPGVPANGIRLDNNFRDGSTVTFKCNVNHELIGNDTIRCEGTVWSNKAPLCKGQCIFKGNPENGYTSNRNLFKGQRLQHGSSIEYACHASYTMDGSKILNCDDGSWDASIPSCKASCHDPGFISNGRRNSNDFSHGDIVTYECTTPGYSLLGNPRLTCNDGTWDSPRPNCGESCPPIPPLSNGKIHNDSTSYGALVSFSCNKGFQLKGLRQILCLDGKWNGNFPSCKGMCNDPGQLDNGKIIGSDYSYNSSIKFKCNSGYNLRGLAALTCKRGVWEGPFPECKKRCQDPGNPVKGWLIGNNFSHGGTVRFVCKNKSLDLIGASNITCNDGHWSHPKPFCDDCKRPLGLETTKNQAIRITSRHRQVSFDYRPNSARLNGPYAWCPLSNRAYLQIDLGRKYKLTAIATQGGKDLNRWVKQYRISFKSGATDIHYSESGLIKDIDGNKDTSSIVKYTFKEPFITDTVRIQSLAVDNDPICLRTELYGCDPPFDCILVGSMFWGYWQVNLNATNYWRAYITKLNATHFDFALKINKEKTRSYRRTEQKLIIDKKPLIKEISPNMTVIANQKFSNPEWYRTGTAIGTSGDSIVRVKFDDGQTKWVPLERVRLVSRPRFCSDVN